MKKAGLFPKMMLYLVCASLLTASLSAVIYFFFGIRAFAHQIAAEMMPHARSISRLSVRYLSGKISLDAYREFILDDLQNDGSHVYIYDDQGNLFAYSTGGGQPFAQRPEIEPKLAAYANRVISQGRPLAETNWRKIDGVLVGDPIRDNLSRVCGAVLVTKPANQLRASMMSLTVTLLMSSVVATVCLTVFAFYGSRRFVSPIRQMTKIANAMATGDFSARADETAGGEVGQLGKALNFLSRELSTTIGELTLTQNRLETILTGLSEGVVALDHTFRQVTFINPAAQRLLDADAADFVKSPAIEQAFYDACARVTDGGGEPAETLHCALGERQLLLTFTRAQLAMDAEPGVIILVQDVTEAERLEQTRRDYVANVSHELRTPIASIRSLAEALNDGLIKNETDRARYYGYILRESLRLSRLIDDLLELSRLQSGAVALTKQSFLPDALLSEAAEHMRIRAEDSDISLCYVHVILPPVCSNRDRIQQVLIALLDNAIKYASDGGTVTLTAEEQGDHVCVFVRNTGHIDETDLPHLFDRFYKADRSHAGQGTGLGLAIAKEILLLLGEDVRVRNLAEEVEFSFTLSKS